MVGGVYLATDFYIHGRETGKLGKKNDEGYFQIFITFRKMRIFECGFRQYVSNLYGKYLGEMFFHN